MNNNPIEDILIDHTPKKEKKKGSGIVWILIFLFIVLIILAVGYFFYQKANIEANKANFFEGFKNSRFGFYTTNNVVDKITENFSDVNSEVITNVKLTNTLELPEKLEGIDLAKMVFDIKTRKSVNLDTQNTDVAISYSDNEIANFRLINEDDKIAVTSPDLITGYVGYNKENQEDIKEELKLPDFVNFGDKDEIAGKISTESIDKEVKNAKISEYANYIINNIDLKKFSANSNYILQKQSSDSINVKAYQLTMSKVEAETMVKAIISKMRQDQELMDALVVKEENEEEEPVVYNQSQRLAPPEEEQNIVEEEQTIVEEELPAGEENIVEAVPAEETQFNVELRLEPRGNQEDVVGSEENPDSLLEGAIVPGEENVEAESIEGEELPENLPMIPYNEEKPEEAVDTEEEMMSTLDIGAETNNDSYALDMLGALMLNKKLKLTDKELDSLFASINKFLTDGVGNLEITVYASDEKTEKIKFVFPSEDTLEVEFETASDTNRTVIITYLSKRDDANVWNPSNDVVPSGETRGFKLTFEKVLNDASFKTKLEYDWIIGKEFYSKIKCDFITKGTANSKKFNTDGTIYYTVLNKGELKATISNIIAFDGQVEIEVLDGQSVVLLDDIDQVERTNLINDIKGRIDVVIAGIKDDMTFIDTNTNPSLIDGSATRSNQFTKEESINALVEAITLRMNSAVESGREYTILELPLLQVPGHTLGVSMEGDVANISIDGYRFVIDKDFNLTEVE